MNITDFSAGEVYSIKLTSGEEVIAKVVGIDTNYKTLKVSHPLTLAGQGLIPAVLTANHDHEVTINSNSIAMYSISSEQVTAKYIEATTGIAVTNKQIIMG